MRTLVVAKVLLFNPAGKMLLLQRSESDRRRPLQWDLPGGHTDGDESVETAAARETLEEAGIAIESHPLKLVYAMTEVVPEDLSVTWVFFFARVDTDTVTLSQEHVASRWVTLDEADELLKYERQKTVIAHVRDNHLV